MRALLLLLLVAPTGAVAQERISRQISAAPSAPTFRYGWQQGTRGRLSTLITVAGDVDAPGWSLIFTPLFEAHNDRTQPAPVPYEYWRGRLALELAHRWTWLSVGVIAEHESDHASVPAASSFGFRRIPNPAFTYVNDVAVRASLHVPFEHGWLGMVATGRLHFATCTALIGACDEVAFGGVGPEVAVDVTFDGQGAQERVDLALTGALHGQLTAGSDRVQLEHRLVALAGLRLPTRTRGSFHLQAGVQVGHELGMLRSRSSAMVGGFLGWTP